MNPITFFSFAVSIGNDLSNFVVYIKVMVFNITYNNISAISLLSVLLVEETGVPGENLRPAASY